MAPYRDCSEDLELDSIERRPLWHPIVAVVMTVAMAWPA